MEAPVTAEAEKVSTMRRILYEMKAGKIFVSRVVRGGRNRRYAYLSVPRDVVKHVGSVAAKPRFEVKVSEGVATYVLSEYGDYSLSLNKSGSAMIRFPIDYEGPVFIELIPSGFRVYY